MGIIQTGNKCGFETNEEEARFIEADTYIKEAMWHAKSTNDIIKMAEIATEKLNVVDCCFEYDTVEEYFMFKWKDEVLFSYTGNIITGVQRH